MFGREFDHLPLIRLLNFDEEKAEEESDEEDREQDIVGEDTSTDWKLNLDHIRQRQRDDTLSNIKAEQIKQKKLYDNKVQANRFVIYEPFGRFATDHSLAKAASRPLFARVRRYAPQGDH